MKSLLFNREGAVSLLGVIVLSSLLLFFGVMIDYARIATFHLQTENAVRTAARSVLSAYDKSLYEQYGLFGRGGTEGSLIFEEVLRKSLEKKEPFLKGGMDMTASNVDRFSLNASLTLGQHPVFARGVLEEMKYKAPVDFTLELISKFTPLAKSLKESSAAIATLDELRSLYERREGLLEEALLFQEKASTTAGESAVLGRVPAGGKSGSGMTAQSFANGLEGYLDMVREDSDLAEDEEPAYADQIAAFQTSASNLASRLASESAAMENAHGNFLDTALNRLDEAAMVNALMKTVLEKAENALPGGYDTVLEGQVPGASPNAGADSAADEIKEIAESGSKLIREESWFNVFEQEINAQKNELASFGRQLRSYGAGIGSAMRGYGGDGLQADVDQMAASFDRYRQNYLEPALLLQQRRNELGEEDVKKRLKEQEKQKKSLWSEAGKLLQGIADSEEREEHREVFRQVKQKYERSLLFNDAAVQDEETEGGASPRSPDANKGAVASASMMDGLFAGISEMLLQSRLFLLRRICGRSVYLV